MQQSHSANQLRSRESADRPIPNDVVANSVTSLKQFTLPVVANVLLTPLPPNPGQVVLDKNTNHLYFSGASGWVQLANSP